MPKNRQTIELSVETDASQEPQEVLRQILEDHGDTIRIAATTYTSAVEEIPDPPPTPEANREALIKVLAWATAEDVKRQHGLPSEWDQDHWFRQQSCGTTCCIAGKAALNAGAQPGPWRPLGGDGRGQRTGYVKLPDGRKSLVPDYAREVLGLTEREASLLFSAANNLASITTVITDVLEGNRLQDPADW